MNAPYNGDDKLNGPQNRAYFRYGWREIRAAHEPEGVQPAHAAPLRPDDTRSPYRVYADTLMARLIPQYATQPVCVVDIGCGSGLYTRLFRDMAGAYHGVDAFRYDEWDVYLAEKEGLVIHFHHMPAEELSALDCRANFSLSSSALEHVDDPQAAIAGLAQLTEPGSYGLHIVPGPWSLMPYGRHGWRRFSAEQLRALFEANGFDPVTLYRLGGAPSTLHFWFWGAGVENGLALQHATFSALPFIIYRALSLLRLPGARQKRLIAPFYRLTLRVALALDRFFPAAPTGYAILVRRRA